MKKVLKFWAPWCGPCKQLSTTFSSIDSPVAVEEINVDDQPELAGQYSVRGIPTLILLDGSTEVARVSGSMPAKELLEFLNQ